MILNETEKNLIIKSIDSIQKSIETINGELGDIVTRVAVLESQISQILWLQRLVLGTIIVGVIGAVVIKKKNSVKK